MKTIAVLIGFFSFVFTACDIHAQITVSGISGFEALADSTRRNRPQLMGYRVLLAFDFNKRLVDSLKIKFQEKNPRTDAYIFFEAPNFKLVVGDFRTEIEALSLAKKLPLEFPLTLVQKMPINLPRID
jgi:hypothetical protein